MYGLVQSVDDLKSMAVEAVLLLQGKINDEDEDTVTICLLVPSKVIGCLIGKSGSIISEIRKRTKAEVRISKGKKPRCADASDELVEVCIWLIYFLFDFLPVVNLYQYVDAQVAYLGGWGSQQC